MSEYRFFDTFQDAVLVIDSDHNVCFGNVAATLLFEVSARRLSSGKPLNQFIEFKPDPISSAGDLLALDQATQFKEVEFSSSSGKSGWAQVALLPQPKHFSPDFEGQRFIVTLRDVTLEKTLFDKYRAELDQKEEVIQDLRKAQAQLEDYSKNLEKMVAARTLELSETNQLLQTILDSLGQGILVFDREGKCLPIYSKICESILEGAPVQKQIEDVLALSSDEAMSFQSWREAVFAEMLDFDELAPLAPNAYANSHGLNIALTYNALRNDRKVIEGVVLVATDQTREIEAKKEAAKEKELVRRVVQVARYREAFRRFVIDTRQILNDLVRINQSNFNCEEVARKLHTIKGGAATFSLENIVSGCHALEGELDFFCENPKQQEEFFAQLGRESAILNSMLNEEVKSLVDLLGNIVGDGESRVVEVQLEKAVHWGRALSQDKSLCSQKIADELLSECFERSIGDSVNRMESSLQSVANLMGKQLNSLELEGAELRVPLGPLQPLLSSLVHCYRNAIDHGLETPEERLAAGKTAAGSIRTKFVKYSNENDLERSWLMIEISDDGRGINPEKIRDKLNRIGRSQWAKESDQEVIQSILSGEFSTADQVTEISGRGVGLSAVADEVKKLDGTIVVHSLLGKGMTLTIRIPLPKIQWQDNILNADSKAA